MKTAVIKTTILATFLFSTLCLFAQRPLEYKDQSQDEVYPLGKNTFARISVSAKPDVRPYFRSSDMILRPVEIDTLADKVYYHLHLDVARPNEVRTLEVSAYGFSPLSIPLVLNTNRWYRYEVYDPDPTIIDCYNQLMREGLKLFTDGMYEEALGKYESAKKCSKVEDRGKIDTQIAVIDSIQMWRSLADAAFARSDYANAILDCQKILEKNPKDEYNRARLTEARTQQREDCGAIFRMAQSYFDENDYNSAQPLYERVIDKSCNESSLAFEKLRQIKGSRQLPHVLTYEYSDQVPIGISSGNYKEHKVAGYFTLRLNPEVFELLRTDKDETLRPELNVSFGWTIKIVKPVWLFFGPGYTGIGQYVADEKKENKIDDELSLKIKHAVSPEAGLLCKLNFSKKVGLALRYTFQYRYALDKADIDYIGKTRHVFGVGFCF